MGDAGWEMHKSICRYYGSDPCAWLSEDLPDCPFIHNVPEECDIDCEECRRLCVCKKQLPFNIPQECKMDCEDCELICYCREPRGKSAYEEYLDIHFKMEEE